MEAAPQDASPESGTPTSFVLNNRRKTNVPGVKLQDETRGGGKRLGHHVTVCADGVIYSCSTMEEKFNRLLFIPIAAVLFLMIGYQYVCPADSNTCYFRSDEKGLFQRYSSGLELLYTEPEVDEDLPSKITSKFNFTERDLDRHVDFNIRGDDVMVFLHIQKTGGTTFGRHLVKNIELEQPCDCLAGQRKCTCHRPGKAESWLFSRFSTGWSCGLHADWTELTSCVPVVMNKRDKKSAPKSKR